MLASIHPLGERARDRRWSVTVTAYALASTGAAALLGAALGRLGGLMSLGPGPTAVLVVVLAASALAVDVGAGGLRLPTVHRQVDKEWLGRYRGWVVGAGFGFQLGLGVVTIVTTAAVYLTLALALLSGSFAAGAAVGASFGLVRAAMILLMAGVRHPDQLRLALRRVQAWRPLSERIGIAAHAFVLVAAGAAAVIR